MDPLGGPRVLDLLHQLVYEILNAQRSRLSGGRAMLRVVSETEAGSDNGMFGVSDAFGANSVSLSYNSESSTHTVASHICANCS